MNSRIAIRRSFPLGVTTPMAESTSAGVAEDLRPSF